MSDSRFLPRGGRREPVGGVVEPLELLLASWATCARLYVLVRCQARGVPIRGLRLEHAPLFDGVDLRGVVLRVLHPAGFEGEHLAVVRAAVNGCNSSRPVGSSGVVEVVALAASDRDAEPIDA